MDQEACKNHGIEYEDGLARFVGNVALYEKFLKQFPDDPCYKQLKEALDKQDIDTAFQAAHTLKGVTGNLSMKDLYDKVSVVVEQLRIKDLSQIDQTLPPLEECYNQMIAFLKES